jgi:flagellar basal-body rod protein FlgG
VTAIGSTIALQGCTLAADERDDMDRGLYIAASGMLAEQVRQDQIANDLANASTAGYKADRTTQQSFGSMLLTNSLTGATIGSQTTAVQVTGTVTDFTPQPLKDTGEPLDFAINGDGFFAVQTAQGTRYTRNGQFGSDAQGRLVTATGNLVLGRNNQPLAIGADGKVDPRQLNVVLLNNPRKTGDNLVTGTPGGAGTAGTVRAGALEGSGADPTQAMVDMIASMRTYEAGQKVIRTIDETLGKAATSVGSVTG